MEFERIHQRNPFRSREYASIAKEAWDLRTRERMIGRIESYAWTSGSVLIAGAAAFSESPFVMGLGLGIAASWWQHAREAGKHVYEPLIERRTIIEDRLSLYYDARSGAVRAGNSGEGLEQIIDARDLEHAAIEVDTEPVLLTNAQVERAGERNYTRIADVSYPIHAFEGSYPWMVVRRARTPRDELVPLASARRAVRS